MPVPIKATDQPATAAVALSDEEKAYTFGCDELIEVLKFPDEIKSAWLEVGNFSWNVSRISETFHEKLHLLGYETAMLYFRQFQQFTAILMIEHRRKYNLNPLTEKNALRNAGYHLNTLYCRTFGELFQRKDLLKLRPKSQRYRERGPRISKDCSSHKGHCLFNRNCRKYSCQRLCDPKICSGKDMCRNRFITLDNEPYRVFKGIKIVSQSTSNFSNGTL